MKRFWKKKRKIRGNCAIIKLLRSQNKGKNNTNYIIIYNNMYIHVYYYVHTLYYIIISKKYIF